jgi:FKBP-type peptidyl-prolyl cis-trans isomerase
MKRKILTLGMVMAVIVGMVGCIKEAENKDEEKAIENEQQIEKYLADSAMTATRDSSGLYYVLKKANPTGAKAKVGDEITIKFDGYLLNGTKITSSANEKNLPFVYPYGSGLRFNVPSPGMEVAVSLLRTGEKATIFMPFYLAFGNYDQGNVPAYSPIKMNLEFVSARSEVQQINDFLTKKQFNVSERTSDNLVIIRTNTVTGDTLGVGKSVLVKYTLKFLDDTKVQEGTNYPITTGTSGSIVGFDRAVRKMRKGEKIIAIFPSALGYGKTLQQGTVDILPYTPLQFELEVL